MAISEQVQQRSDLIGTQVITRDTGKKLGVINQLWVDVDQREVVALGLRSTLFTGEQRYMLLSSVRQIGDVILVDDEDSIEDVNVYNYSTLIGNEVVTETGELIGKVRGFKIDTANGQISDLVIASFGLPFIPTQLISTYELAVSEIVSSGPERLIVFEGSEERMNQLSVGLMERLGIGGPPWEQEEEDYLPAPTSTSNQLGSGIRPTSYPPARRVAQPVEESWEQEGWDEPVAPPQRQVRQAPVPRYEEQYDEYEEPYDEYEEDYEYEDELEEDNWSEQEVDYAEPAPYAAESRYEDMEKDAWEVKDVWADEEDTYQAPQVNIPEKQKAPEYEPEREY